MVTAVATPAIPTSGPRIIIWSAVCSLAIHALVGWWGLRLIPAGPGELAGFGATRNAGTMVWLSDREPAAEPPPPKPKPREEINPPAIPPPPPAAEPQPIEVPRKFTLGEDKGDPTKETLISSDRELEHAARQSKVEQPALSPEAGGGGGGGGGGGTPASAASSVIPATAEAAKSAAAATAIVQVPTPPNQQPEIQPPAPAAPAPEKTPQQEKREQQDRVDPTPETRAAIAPGSGSTAKPEPAAAKPTSEPPPPAPKQKNTGAPADRDQELKEEKKEQKAQAEQKAQEGSEKKPEAKPDPLSKESSDGSEATHRMDPGTSAALTPVPEKPTEPAASETDKPFDPSSFVGPPAPPPEADIPAPPVPPSKAAPPAPAALAPAPASPAPGTPGAPGLPGTTGDAKLDDAAWLSEKVSDPTSLRRAATFQNGKVTAGKGLELVVTRRPESTTYTRLLGAARNPTFDIQFDRSGEVREVIIVRSSGNRALDEDIRNAMHFWRARGSDLASLSPRPESMLTVRLTVLLFGE